MVDRVLFVAVKRGNIRGELFNTSFLLLCHIGQVYGRKVGFLLINTRCLSYLLMSQPWSCRLCFEALRQIKVNIVLHLHLNIKKEKKLHI